MTVVTVHEDTLPTLFGTSAERVALQASAYVGIVFRETDTGNSYRSNGSTWAFIIPGDTN